MTDRIENIEKASQDIRKHFESILKGRLLSLDIEEMNDEQVLSALTHRLTDKGRGPGYLDNLCSWYTIGESKELIFGRPYKQICLMQDDETIMEINYSRFRYPLSFNKQKYALFGNKSGTNTIDDKVIDPETYFHDYYGEKVLYICGITGADTFGKERQCAFFAKDNIDPDHIRKYIMEAQLTSLIEILYDPVKYSILPPTDIIREYEGRTLFFKDSPYSCAAMDELATKIWSEEFFSTFKSRYEYLLSRYATK